MSWIESHRELKDHPKTRKAMRLLGLNTATMVGHLHLLWWWALEYAQDGNLSGFENWEIEEAAMWEGDPNTFVEGLANCGKPGEAGFIERIEYPDGTTSILLRDWHDYAGRLIEQRKKNAERMRIARAGTNTDSATHVQSTHGARAGATVPNRTVPDLTVPDRTKPEGEIEAKEETKDVLKESRQQVTQTENPPKKKRQPPKLVWPEWFNLQQLWDIIIAQQGSKPSWNYGMETKAVNRLVTKHKNVTPEELAAFLAYKRTCYRADPLSQVTFTQYEKDFAVWYAGGMPTKQEGTNGNINPAVQRGQQSSQPDKWSRSSHDQIRYAQGLLATENHR